MTSFISAIKSIIQLILLIRTIVNEFNKAQEEKRAAEAEKKASRRSEIEKELSSGQISSEKKRKLLSDLNDNSF